MISMPRLATGAALLALLLSSACSRGEVEHSTYDAVRDELLRMEEEDQLVSGRTASTSEELRAVLAEMEALSERHTRRMKEIVATHGWPTTSAVGEDAARAAWLLVQHADHDPAFQRRILELIEPLVAAGEVKSSHYAYLWDRTHDPQRYGTQGGCIARGVWEPRAIEAPPEVDARRAAAGIIPSALADYAQLMSAFCEDLEDLRR